MKFPVNVLKRNISWNGKEYTFNRNRQNEFNETIDGSYDLVTTLKGLFHEVKSYVTIYEGESSRVQSKTTPMLMCLYLDAQGIKFNDKVMINDTLYKVNGLTDINEEKEIIDISLEVIE
jgi:hypothetical protein